MASDSDLRARVARARVARLATVRPDGAPHLVPCVFALDGDTVYTPIDRKPKRSTDLQRLRNIDHDPRVALLIDHYDDDWDALWWARLDGRARVLAGGEAHRRALELLAAKYEQYRAAPPEDRMIAIEVDRWRAWHA